MVVRGVSKLELRKLADNLDLIPVRVEWLDRKPLNGYRVILRPKGARYSLFTDRGYNQRVVCQHGQTAFLRDLFASFPQAKVETLLMNYDGAEDFGAKQSEAKRLYHEKYGSSRLSCRCAVPLPIT